MDLQIATPGFPLALSRTYESARPADSPLGVGWTSNLAARLHYATYLYAAPSEYRKEADIVMPTGRRYRFVENADGSFTPPSSRHDLLVRNADGAFDLTIADGSSRYHFGATGRMETIADEFGNTLAYTYDSNDRLQRVADLAGSGRYLDLYYGADGRISAVQDHTGRSVQYGYDTRGALITVTDPASRTMSYSYTMVRFAPLLTRIADAWGRSLSDITYDTLGRTKTYTEQGETYTYTYNYDGRADQSSKVDSAGNRWVYTYATDGVVTDRAFPGGPLRRVIYNADRSIQQETDEVGVVTAYTYGPRARVESITRDAQGPSAVRFEYGYDPVFDNVTSVLAKIPPSGGNDPTWQGWTYDYYPSGSTAPGALHRVYRLRDDGVTTDLMASYTYDGQGRVLSATDSAGAVTDYAYDAAGNLASVTAPANNANGARPVTAYGYDAVGRVTSVIDPLGKTTSYTYDPLDRILTVTLPKPVAGSPLDFTTTYSYDQWEAATQLTNVQVTDPNGVVTRQFYDQFGRLRRSVDGLGQTTSYGYTRDLLSSITDANGNTTSYEYNGLKRLTATVFPDGLRESYAYTADGLLSTRTDRKNQLLTFTYDAHKRLKRKSYPGGGYVEYTFAGQKLTQVYDTSVTPAETHSFGYDGAFRMSTNTQAGRGTLTYGYLPGDLVGTVSVAGGPATTYTYYPEGSMQTIGWSAIGTGTFQYGYRLNGQYGTITFPNGQTRSHGYDDQGRLLQIANAHPTAGTLATFDYGYDLNHATGAYDRLGQRVTVAATVPSQSLAGAVTQYRYDASYQLVQASDPTEVQAWTYDGIGNRLTSTVNGTTTSSTYRKIGTNPNNWQRLLSDGVSAYTYDNNGNTLTQGANTYGWDAENRMTSISGGAAASYRYDYQGRRTSKTVGGVTTTYLYDGLNLIAETGANYLFGPGIDEPLAVERGGAVAYYAADGLGSIQTVTDAAGTIQNSYSYDAWGSARAATELIPQPFRYTGREVGDAAGQYFYRARYYAPGVGRFLSEDPLRFPRSDINSYRYVLNRPTTLLDPMGLYAEPRSPNTSGCCGNKENEALSAASGVCKNSRVNRGCQAVLRKTGLFDCFRDRCRGDKPFNIVCVPEKTGCSQSQCGGPCFGFGKKDTIYLQKSAGTGCNNGIPPGMQLLRNTVAHEMAHMCGVGADTGAYGAEANLLKANNVGAACDD